MEKVLLVGALLFLSCAKGDFIRYSSLNGKPYSVTYDHRSFFINGERAMFLSGAVHYPRSTPAMWPDIFDMAVASGLNTIQTYVFWNIHEAERGIYDFSGRYDLIQFIQQAAAHDLFVTIRFGPYVDAEWDYGGFPIWLRDLPGIQFRTYNTPFMNEMATFVKYITEMVRPYFATNGGNLILAQIENEVHLNASMEYVNWCGEFAASLDIGVPWIMCNGLYANNTIETCNGFYCDSWIATHWREQPDKPPAWTENEGWFDTWGAKPYFRATSDVAYSVARYFAYGGAHHDYYMFYGGNNYGLTAAASVTTSYANDVMVDSLCLPHEPKFSFLAKLNTLIANYSTALFAQNPPAPNRITDYQDMMDYGDISFLSNNSTKPATVEVAGHSFYLSPMSVLILDANANILFNTSEVNNTNIPHKIEVTATNLTWTWYREPIGPTLKGTINNPSPVEQLAISQDETDYVWYSAEVSISSPGNFSAMSIQSQAYSIFLNGTFMGAHWDVTHACCYQVNITVPLKPYKAGNYKLDILSTAIGIESGGMDSMDQFTKGMVGNVFIGSTNITTLEGNNWWTMQKGLVGEALEIYQNANYNLVNWSISEVPVNSQVTWYATKFNCPTTTGTVALDITGLGKGIAYVNGNSLGRYWTLGPEPNNPTQSLYHIPPDWLLETANSLVLFEELGATDLSSVKIVVVS